MRQQQRQETDASETIGQIPVPPPSEPYSTKVPSAKVAQLRPRPTRGGGKVKVFQYYDQGWRPSEVKGKVRGVNWHTLLRYWYDWKKLNRLS